MSKAIPWPLPYTPSRPRGRVMDNCKYNQRTRRYEYDEAEARRNKEQTRKAVFDDE